MTRRHRSLRIVSSCFVLASFLIVPAAHASYYHNRAVDGCTFESTVFPWSSASPITVDEMRNFMGSICRDEIEPLRRMLYDFKARNVDGAAMSEEINRVAAVSPMELATIKEHPESFALLLDMHFGTEKQELDACLAVAERGRPTDIILLLLRKRRDRIGGTLDHALWIATKRGDDEMVTFLLRNGADARVIIDGMTPLMLAVDGGKILLVRTLLGVDGGDVNEIATFTYTCEGCESETVAYSALIRAAALGRTEIAKLLIDRGADVNALTKSGNAPLLEAAEEGHEDTVKLLIEEGADVQRFGTEALQLARDGRHIEIGVRLRHAGAPDQPIDFRKPSILRPTMAVNLRGRRPCITPGCEKPTPAR